MRLTPYLRGKVVHLKKKGMSYSQIQNYLDEYESITITKRALMYLMKVFRSTGQLVRTRNLANKKLTDAHINLIDETIEQNPEISTSELSNLIGLTGIQVSPSWIRAKRKQLGWVRGKTKYCQLIRQNNKPKRLNWCLLQLANNEKFENVIWSDESSIEMEKVAGFVYHRKGEHPRLYPKPKHSPKISVWGAISMEGPSALAIFEGIVDSQAYQTILEDHLLPLIAKFPNGYRFMQDNARPHTSRSTKSWMEDNNINWWETPPESPDLNPIENVWHAMKEFLRRRVKPTTKQQLTDGIKTFWSQLTKEKCQRYIKHLHTVMPVVVVKQGTASGY